MPNDSSVDTYVENNIRRHTNGSIDYGFYDQRAREGRGVAFRSTCRSVVALVRCLITRFADNRAKRQSLIQQRQIQPTVQLADQRCGTSAAAQNTYSEAA